MLRRKTGACASVRFRFRDKGLETLELWKKRTLVAFLLISLCLGAAALLVLEAGVVYKVFVSGVHFVGSIKRALVRHCTHVPGSSMPRSTRTNSPGRRSSTRRGLPTTRHSE